MNPEARARKERPLYEGLFKYFPDALEEVAHLSLVANEQHNPGEPLHWDKDKSKDEWDAMLRHTADEAKGIQIDTDGIYHDVKVAWRALAKVQRRKEGDKPLTAALKDAPFIADTPSTEKCRDCEWIKTRVPDSPYNETCAFGHVIPPRHSEKPQEWEESSVEYMRGFNDGMARALEIMRGENLPETTK